jgi:hypothetical protein
MQINVTFIIQIIHFIIVYLVLKRYFFKNIIFVLQEKEKTRQMLTSGLKDKEMSLGNLQEEKKKDLFDFRLKLKEKYLFAHEKPQEIPSGILYEQDEKRITHLLNTVEHLIIEKAPHAF